jgi:hypothetical protein
VAASLTVRDNSDMSDEPDDSGDLDARETARARRRDRDASAEQRDLMKPGMGKVFKQIQDAQAKAAAEPAPRKKQPRRRS